MPVPRGGVQVTVTYRADILVSLMTERGPVSVMLDQDRAELLVEALAEACDTARDVQELGEAVDAVLDGN